MSEGYSIRFVDLNGRPLDDLTSDQTFRIELYVPKGMGDPGDIVEVEFVTSEGTADLDVTWTDTTDDEWVFTSTWLTVSGGGAGGGDVTVAGFSWSTGNLDPGEIKFEDGAPLSVQFEHPDGGTTQDGVILYDTPVTMGLAHTAAYIAEVDRVFRNTLINIAAARVELEQYPESGERDEIEAALDALEAETQRRQQFVVAARSSIYRDEWVAHSRLAVARGYLEYLQLPPELFGDVRWTDALDRERANKERSDEEVQGIVMRGLGQATIGAYRLFANATLVAQIRTLIFGENEIGQEVGWGERTLALLDLITEAATMGASMRFQLDHLATPTQPRTQLPPATTDLSGQPTRWTDADGWRTRARALGDGGSLDAPRFQGDRLSAAATGDLLAAEQVGMMRQATVEAQRIARIPRDGAPNGTLIWTRPTGLDGLQWRRQGYAPKGPEIKSKTIKDIDVLLGAEPGSQGIVGLFEPVLPLRTDFDPAFFRQVEKRFAQRLDEFNGTIGDHMRGLEADGLIRFDNGVVINTGLYDQGVGKGITGDYDLFEITDLDGKRVSADVYDEILGELMEAPSFQALHGAHMRWRDLEDFFKPAKRAENEEIFNDVVGKHARSGQAEEPLVVFGGDRPAFAVWSDELPTRHFSDLPESFASVFGHTLSPEGVFVSGISPLFIDQDADQQWEEQWNALVEQTHAVLRRNSLRDEDDDTQDPEIGEDSELDAAWFELLRQLDGAGGNPSILDYLNESPYAPPPDDLVPDRPDAPDAPPHPTPEETVAPDEPDAAWDAEVARANARLSGDSNLEHTTGLDDYGDGDVESNEEVDESNPEWDAVVKQAEARSRDSILDHETGLDDEVDPILADLDRLDTLGEPATPPEESVLNHLYGEPDLGHTPVPPTESVLDYIDAEPERSPTSPFQAIDREVEAERAAEEQSERRGGVPVWVWPAVAIAIVAIGGFFAFGGGGDNDPEAGVSAGIGTTPARTATVPAAVTTTGPGVTATAEAAATPRPQLTPGVVQIPTLRICPDGSSFSGYEQPDGTFLDAETNEPRMCPPPPN